MNEQVRTLQELFVKTYHTEPEIIGRAPGRVNLIGEHTDYNGGFVFPMAINFQILLAAKRRPDSSVRIFSADYGEQVEFSLATPVQPDGVKRWSNYLRGVFVILQQAGITLPGVDIVFCGDIPQGSGLSSSAALEVGTAVVLQKMTGFAMTPPELAKQCQKAENEFVGMKCGIMDQFISMMGQANRALFLDCRSLEYQQIPLELGDYRILICQSGVKHALVDSEYNKRRQECEQGVAVIAGRFPAVKQLRDASLEQLAACRAEMDEIVFKRCHHVITEDNRVWESVAALQKGDLATFGRLMNASHDSLRDAYQVSCPEIDFLVNLAREVPGVLGARITGGGFGGCTVNLIAAAAVETFEKNVTAAYRRQTGIEPKMYISTAAKGAEIL